MKRRRTEDPERRRRRILEASQYVLLKTGYPDLRLDDVARRAGIAKGTLYLYFKNKGDLFYAVFADTLDRLDACLSVLPPEMVGKIRLSGMIENILRFADNNQQLLFHFTQAQPDLRGTQAEKRLTERYVRHLRSVGEHLQRFRKEGVLRRCNAFTGGLYVDSLLRMFLIEKSLTKSPGSLVRRSQEFMDFILHGLGAEQ